MTAFRPDPLHQGPASACIITNYELGWLNCTPTSTAMAIDKATLGAKTPNGCDIRKATGDYFGGTTLSQCTGVATAQYGVAFEVHTGSNLLTPRKGGAALKAGRGLVVQGNTGPLLNTVHRSTNGPVNHAVYVNEGKGWDGDIPESVLVYDPAADGRRPGIATSPDWWTWALLLKFAAALEPNGEGTGHLGTKGWYAAIAPDTEPHVLLKFGGKRTKPFPDRTRATGDPTNVHSSPTTGSDTVIGTIAKGALFIAYQKTSGQSFEGSPIWFGSEDGKRWVHSKRLSHEGGST